MTKEITYKNPIVVSDNLVVYPSVGNKSFAMIRQDDDHDADIIAVDATEIDALYIALKKVFP